MFCKKGVLKIFAKFTGKHICQSLFFNKVAGLRPEALVPGALFSPGSKNKKQSTPKKNSSYMRKWNFIALKLKHSYIFSKESFSYISGKGTLHFSAQARKIKKFTPRKFLILQERETPKKFVALSAFITPTISGINFWRPA